MCDWSRGLQAPGYGCSELTSAIFFSTGVKLFGKEDIMYPIGCFVFTIVHHFSRIPHILHPFRL
jgi:hypothetical protein